MSKVYILTDNIEHNNEFLKSSNSLEDIVDYMLRSDYGYKDYNIFIHDTDTNTFINFLSRELED